MAYNIRASFVAHLHGLTTYIKSNWLSLFSAFILGLGFPLWRIYVIEVPDVRVEVTEVDKKSDPMKIDLLRDSAFKPLFDARPSITDSRVNRTVDLDEAQSWLDSQGEGIERQQSRSTELHKSIDDLKGSVNIDLSTATRLNISLFPEVPFNSSIFHGVGDPAAIADLRKAFIERFEKEVTPLDAYLITRKDIYEKAKIALRERRERAEMKESRVHINCVVSNAGGGAVSLKPQAFLRVYLGGNNYIDIELTMPNYGEKGTLQPKSSQIITFTSDPMVKLRETDQDKVATYFKQNAPAILFIIDIESKIYQSNTVPFAKGLYQQTVFDRLRSEASKRLIPEPK
ncbi:hypothetical protein AAKU55_003519 [Oxalobacteraceae bacterium GrIS 1.11]